MRSFADVALELHRAGLNVLPVDANTKRPRVPEWRCWQREAQPAAEVDRLRREFPTADIAVVLGGPSLALVDIETDSTLGEKGLRSSRLPLPPTSAFVSPRGVHRLYRAPGRLPRRRILRGVDFLGGGYVIVPPSVGRAWTLGLDHLANLPGEWTSASRERAPSGLASPSPLPNRSPVASRSVPVLLATTPDLLATEAAPTFLPAVVRVLGVPTTEVGRSFRCVLHRDERPSVTLWRRGDGTVHYEDFHTGQTYTLAEVYAAQLSHAPRHLRGPELATWKLRLLVDAGLVEPAPVAAPPLRVDAAPYVQRVYAGFLHLISCRWLYTPGAPTPFTWKFAAAWCGVTERQAGAAIRELLRLNVLRIVGIHERTGLKLFLPGEVDHVQAIG